MDGMKAEAAGSRRWMDGVRPGCGWWWCLCLEARGRWWKARWAAAATLAPAESCNRCCYFTTFRCTSWFLCSHLLSRIMRRSSARISCTPSGGPSSNCIWLWPESGAQIGYGMTSNGGAYAFLVGGLGGEPLSTTYFMYMYCTRQPSNYMYIHPWTVWTPYESSIGDYLRCTPIPL